MGYCCEQVMSEFSQPVSLRHKLSPVSQPQQATRLLQVVVWLLQNRLLLQLHTYTYFMPTDSGLSVTQVSVCTFIIIILLFSG